MRVARWRWVLVPMVVVVAGCLPHPTPDLPADLLASAFGHGATFTVQTPPAGATGQDMAAALRAAEPDSRMLRGLAVPIFGIVDCHGSPVCTADLGAPGGRGTIWVLIYPDCKDATGEFGWAIVNAVMGVDGGRWLKECSL